MYNARIETKDGKSIDLGFEYGVVFDISPLSGLDVDIATSQSFQQIGESVDNTSVLGLTREINGVIFVDEKKIYDKLLSVFSAFSSGRLYVGDRYCDFTTAKTPFFVREKTGRLSFSTLIYCPYPFWLGKDTTEYVFGETDPAFSFPVVYDTHTFGIINPISAKNCYNGGNVKRPMTIKFSSPKGGYVKNFGIRNLRTGEFLKINQTISSQDSVSVYQEGGKLHIEFISDGNKYNIIRKLAEYSTLFDVETGDNVLVPFADEGIEFLGLSIKFNTAYTGVFV